MSDSRFARLAQPTQKYRAAGVWRDSGPIGDLRRWRDTSPDAIAIGAYRAGLTPAEMSSVDHSVGHAAEHP